MNDGKYNILAQLLSDNSHLPLDSFVRRYSSSDLNNILYYYNIVKGLFNYGKD